MKRLFVLTCLMAFAFMLSAQDGQRRGFQMTPEQQEQYYSTLKKDLNLNDTQLNGIKKIDTEYRTKMQDARDKADGDRDKMREDFTKLRTEQNAKIKPLLSADQYKKYEELQAQRRPGGGGNR